MVHPGEPAGTLAGYMRSGLPLWNEGAWPTIRDACLAGLRQWTSISVARALPDCKTLIARTEEWLDALGIQKRVELFEPLATAGLRRGMIAFHPGMLSLHTRLTAFHAEARAFGGLCDLDQEVFRDTRRIRRTYLTLEPYLIQRIFYEDRWGTLEQRAIRDFPFMDVSLPGLAVSASLYAAREKLSAVLGPEGGFAPSESSLQVGGSLHLLRDAFYAGAGWLIELPRVLFVVPLPRAFFDVQMRLHSDSAPALEWCDGLKEYCWHGVRVHADFIMRPETITVGQILEEENAEVRRTLIERIGLERFAAETKPKVLDVDYDAGGRRELLRIRLANDEPLVMAKVVCPSTGRNYFLRVPPAMRTCNEAIAWTFGFGQGRYKPVAEA